LYLHGDLQCRLSGLGLSFSILNAKRTYRHRTTDKDKEARSKKQEARNKQTTKHIGKRNQQKPKASLGLVGIVDVDVHVTLYRGRRSMCDVGI
jgi:hypothetical protein